MVTRMSLLTAPVLPQEQEKFNTRKKALMAPRSPAKSHQNHGVTFVPQLSQGPSCLHGQLERLQAGLNENIN